MWIAAGQPPLSSTLSQIFLKFMSIESATLFNLISSTTAAFSIRFPSSPASGSFSMSQLFLPGSKSIGPSGWVTAFPVTVQGWCTLLLTSLISLLCKGLSRVFSSTKIWKHQFFSTLPYASLLIFIYEYQEKHKFDYMNLCWQTDVFTF